MDVLASLDAALYRAINQFCGTSQTLDRIAYHLAGPTGIIFLGFFGLLWFKLDGASLRRRECLVMVIPAVALSLVLNRVISTLLPFRLRPMYALGSNPPSYPWPFDLENWSSFPSDNATYLFAITACLWAISRPAGTAFGIFSTLIVIGRIYFGIHYPSDVLAGAILGFLVGYALTRPAVTQSVSRLLLGYEKRVPSYFYALLFMALAEVVGGFRNTREIGVAAVNFFRGYGGS